ncbi:MAG: diphosphomevalonate decarboxylase [Lentimicrobiaceae bacterium]|nr:diphosphomevalonate decarboxylase [Lentimicrobiaceae bacterium]
MNNLFETYRNQAVKNVPKNFSGTVKWQSPSNIALTKYWGKSGNQLPRNPSISFTLQQARTETSIAFEQAPITKIDFLFEGKNEPVFEQKISNFLMSLNPCFPFLDKLKLTINSRNTFPHSSGIASSASAMSALVLCLLDIERLLSGKEIIDLRKASFFARLGSGSACRSVFEKLALWGEMAIVPESSNEYAVPLADILHPNFQMYHDSILIVSAEKKMISSSIGHALMNDNPFAETRYESAKKHTETLLQTLKTSDYTDFIRIVEAEALQLHALMLCSEPSFILLKPNTLQIIEKVRAFRSETDIPLCFTLDAGPNVHLLYPEQYKEQIHHFINNELLVFCHEKQWISDSLGNGPSSI